MTAYILNLADLAFTLYALCHGGVELNPAMRCVPIMILYKIFVVGALCWWLQKQNTPIAHRGLIFLTAVFSAVNLWHIYFILGGMFQ